MKIRAVIFDVGGVLVDWRSRVAEFIKEYGIREDEWLSAWQTDIVLAHTGKISREKFFMSIVGYLGRKELFNRVEKMIPEEFRLINEVFELIKELKDRFYLGVITNAEQGTHERFNKVYDLKRYFEVFIDSSEVGMMKPDKRIYLLACKELGVKPGECLYIDDAEENLIPAQKLGMKTIFFKQPKRSIEEIKQVLKMVK